MTSNETSAGGWDSPRPLAADVQGVASAMPRVEEAGEGVKMHGSTNYALSPVDGYEGLLLHAISPKWAEVAFPYLATPPVEGFVMAVLVVVSVVATLPFLIESLPLSLCYISTLNLVPAIHRIALIDLRVLRLLLRQVGSGDSFYPGTR
jgi:hypothetical protein